MPNRTLAVLTEAIRKAARADDPANAIRAVLESNFANAAALDAAIIAQPEDEVLLFEDDTCSIWTCRYDPAVLMPPHEHRMPVHIAVYGGREVEVMFRRDEGRLEEAGRIDVDPGKVVSLGPEAVHSVTAVGAAQSRAIRDGVMRLSKAQFEALFEGLDWRRVYGRRIRRPAAAE